jgi:hypothetical protein
MIPSKQNELCDGLFQNEMLNTDDAGGILLVLLEQSNMQTSICYIQIIFVKVKVDVLPLYVDTEFVVFCDVFVVDE